MKIKCPQCDTTYDVSEEIANSGADVQCAKCANIFVATPLAEVDSATEDAETPSLLSDEEKAVFAKLSNESPDDESPEPETLLSEEEMAIFAKLSGKSTNETDVVEEPADSDPLGEKEKEEAESDNDIDWVTPEEPAVETQVAPEAEAEDPFYIESEPGEPVEISQGPEEPEIDPFAAEEGEPLASFDEIELKSEAEGEDEIQPEPEFESEIESEPETESAPLNVNEPSSEAESDSAEPALEGDAPEEKGFRVSPVVIGWAALAASILIFFGSAVLFRVSISKALPGMADVYESVGLPVNVRGLEFNRLSHQWENKGGLMRLIVRGEIVNITDDPVAMPEIVFAMLDSNGLEFFQWTELPETRQLSPRGSTRFRAQIPAPADRVRQLKIRFAKR